MVKSTLFKKSINDMKKNKVPFISIFLMAVVALCVVVGLDCIWETYDVRSQELYDATSLADLWVTIVNPTERDLWKIKHIDGVTHVEKRFMADATVKLKGNPTLRVYAAPSKNSLDQPFLEEGTSINKNGAILDESFAKKHNLQIGDFIEIKLNDYWLRFRIDALAFNSEHVLSLKDSTSVQPDPRKFGFIMVNIDQLQDAYGNMKLYNQIEVRLSPESDINAVAHEIDNSLGDRLIGITTWVDNRSISGMDSRILQFKTLSTVFPIMFFLVAALITLSTMSRLVEDQRTQIGILKAMGYDRRTIVWHYTSYGIYVGLLGALLGIFLGPFLIGKVLINYMKIFYVLPSYRLSFNLPNIVASTLLILFCTGGVSWYSCRTLLKEKTAVLLRDEPPPNGNHVFLEKLPSIWNQLRFSQKLIVRNILRNKGRLILSILGVTGCTGLIIGAFTLYSMVVSIVDITFDDIYTYDQKVVLDDTTTHRDILNLDLDAITQDVEETQRQVKSDNGQRRMAMVTIYPKESPLIHLKDYDEHPITLPEDGVVVTRKFAELLGVKNGGSLLLKRTDDSYVRVPIHGIAYMVSGQGIFMTNEYWEKIGEDFHPSALLIKWNGTEDTQFLNSRYVESHVNRLQQKSDFKANLKVVYIAAMMLIIAGGILAFVVLYNVSLLNFSERTRDLATLKVLGFYSREIRSLVLVENILSATLGIVAGIPVGKLISSIIAMGFGEDFDMVSHLTIANVFLSGMITILFTIFVNRIVSKRMHQIDMLEALKSVE